jgi:hypothetical protein
MRHFIRFGLLAAVATVFLSFSASNEAQAAPPNDNFADAIPITSPAISGIVATGNNIGATMEAGEPSSCPSGGSIGASAWYTWTSPASPGTVVFNTYGSGTFDTVLSIYTGGAVNSLVLAACNDDFVSRPSVLAFTPAPNTTYRIQIGGFGGGQGNFVLSMSTGAVAIVNVATDNNIRDSDLTLREAMFLANGGLTFAGLTVGEQAKVTNGAAAGAGADMIYFAQPNTFPVAAPVTIPVTSVLPNLSLTGDTVSGIGAGVNIQPGSSINCFEISGTANRIEGLLITGCGNAITITGPNNQIGGPLALQRNVIGGSSFMFAITVSGASATGNVIKGNYIGTNAAGTALSVINAGIVVNNGANSTFIGGSAPGEGNVISGATGGGTQIGLWVTQADGVEIVGNKIGTNAAGTAAIPNNLAVRIGVGSQGNFIGALGVGEGNLIAFNNSSAISLETDATAWIRGNSIHSNGGGISSNSTGTPATPVITSALGGVVSGTACANCAVDIYDDAGAQGRIYRGTTSANPVGNFTLSGVIHTLANFTAIATNANNSSSMFSAPAAAPLNLDGDGAADSFDPCPNTAEDYDEFQDGDGCPESDNDVDGVCDPGQFSVSCSGSDNGRTCFDPAGTLSCGVIDCRNMGEDVDAFKDSDGCPEPDNDNDGQADADDDCDGTDAHAGANGMLGSPQDVNHNGISDGAEGPLTTDDVVKVFEDYDTVLDGDGCHDSPDEDFDSDGYTDDAEAGMLLCLGAVNEDSQDDAVINDGCPGGPPVAGSFSEGQARIGTNAGYPCGGSSWPSDLDTQPFSFNELDIFDLTSFLAPVRHLDSSPPNVKYGTRWDLRPGRETFAQWINIQDITALLSGGTGNPPMFSNTRAFGKVCPLAAQ